jgi:hypothetical protein
MQPQPRHTDERVEQIVHAEKESRILEAVPIISHGDSTVFQIGYSGDHSEILF